MCVYNNSIIPDDTIQLIKQARKSPLFTEGNIWMKKVKMPYLMLQRDRMMVRRSVSLLVLSNIIYKENIGLYRDDGLSAIENANELKLDRLRKDVIAISHNEGLKITIDTNLTTTDFLDVTLRSIHWKIVSTQKTQ